MRKSDDISAVAQSQEKICPSSTKLPFFQNDSVYSQDLINPVDFDIVVRKLRKFFESKGYVEVHTQSRLSILAACEDPTTVQTYDYLGQTWPLPQTGQMWLEYELLTKPEQNGFFCVSTSFRHEKNAVAGRHKYIFPMFEFETHGDSNDLQNLEIELLDYLGITSNAPCIRYEDMAKHYKVKELTSKEEEQMWQDFGNALLLTHFPIYTSPFWNMKVKPETPDVAQKIDVIICGQETIGSAERSSDPEVMRHMFKTISEGQYAKRVYDLFTEERVNRELEDFLSLDFIPRIGGGIGLTRLVRAMKLLNLI